MNTKKKQTTNAEKIKILTANNHKLIQELSKLQEQSQLLFQEYDKCLQNNRTLAHDRLVLVIHPDSPRAIALKEFIQKEYDDAIKQQQTTEAPQEHNVHQEGSTANPHGIGA